MSLLAQTSMAWDALCMIVKSGETPCMNHSEFDPRSLQTSDLTESQNEVSSAEFNEFQTPELWRDEMADVDSFSIPTGASIVVFILGLSGRAGEPIR